MITDVHGVSKPHSLQGSCLWNVHVQVANRSSNGRRSTVRQQHAQVSGPTSFYTFIGGNEYRASCIAQTLLTLLRQQGAGERAVQRQSTGNLSEERVADRIDGTATASTSGSRTQTAEEALTDVPDFTPLTNGKGCGKSLSMRMHHVLRASSASCGT